MANLSAKMVFQLLLMLTLVIQPVMTAYAMASMPVSMQHTGSAAVQEREACHSMKQTVADTHHGAHQMADDDATANADMGDCCHSGACCSFAVFDVVSFGFIPSPAFSAQLPISWGSVVLSSEFKPPRTLLS